MGLSVSVAVLAGHTAACAQGTDAWRLDVSEPLTYFVEEGSSDSGFVGRDRDLAVWALEAWARQIDPTLELQRGPEDSATIRVYWVRAGAGLYGEMRARFVEGRRAADVFVRPDTDGLGPAIGLTAREDRLFRDTVVYLTCVHELGHAFGLPHTSAFADIMYSFQYGGDFVDYFMRFREKLEVRDDIRRASPFSAADVMALRDRYR